MNSILSMATPLCEQHQLAPILCFIETNFHIQESVSEICMANPSPYDLAAISIAFTWRASTGTAYIKVGGAWGESIPENIATILCCSVVW